MEETLTLHDVAGGFHGTRELKIVADDWGMSIITPSGEELFIELHSDRLTVRHYQSQDDENPAFLLYLGETS